MTFISLPNVGTLTLDAVGLLQAHPALIQQIAGDGLMHGLQKYLGRIKRRRGLTRRQMRKMSNRKKRRFVDNIIMHHKRLHDHNRALIISNARSRALAKRGLKKMEAAHLTPAKIAQKAHDHSYHSSSFKERASSLRGRVDARKLRARSRWVSMMGNDVDG